MSDNFAVGTTIPLRSSVVVDRSGTVIAGSTTLTVEIERDADGYFWDWDDSTFKASGWTLKAGPLAAVSDAPGWYKRTGGWNSTSQSAGFYWVTYRDTALAAGNMPQSEELYLGGTAAGVADVQTRLPAALVGGRMDASVGALGAGSISAATFAAGAVDATALAADAVTEIQSGLATGTNVTDARDAVLAKLPASLVAGRIDASVGAMAAGVVTAAAIATDAIDADALAASAVAEIQSGLAVPGSAMTLADDAITAAKIAAGAIGASEAPLLGTISTDVTSILAFGAPPSAATVATQVWATATTDGLYTYGAALSRLHRRQRHPFRLLANGTIQYFAVNGVTVETTRAMTDVDGNAITAPAAGDPARAAVEVDV